MIIRFRLDHHPLFSGTLNRPMRTPYVLMVENDEDDQYITRQYFNEHSVDTKIFSDGAEMMRHLRECAITKEPLPAVILLDYHLLPATAVDIISLVRRSAAFAHIPIVVLSGTKSADIVRECYRSGANSFIQKPSTVEEIDRKISSFLGYWLHTVELAS